MGLGEGASIILFLKQLSEQAFFPKRIDGKNDDTMVYEINDLISLHDPKVWRYNNIDPSKAYVFVDATGALRRTSAKTTETIGDYRNYVRRTLLAPFKNGSGARKAMFVMDHGRNEAPLPKQKEHNARYGDLTTEAGRLKRESNRIDSSVRIFDRDDQKFPENFNSIFGNVGSRQQFNAFVLGIARGLNLPPNSQCIVDGVSEVGTVMEVASGEAMKDVAGTTSAYLKQAEADILIPFHMQRALDNNFDPHSFIVNSADMDFLIILLLFVDHNKYLCYSSPLSRSYNQVWWYRKNRRNTVTTPGRQYTFDQQQCVDIVQLHEDISKVSPVRDFCVFMLMCGSDYTTKLKGVGFKYMLQAFFMATQNKVLLVRNETEICYKVYSSIIRMALALKHENSSKFTIHQSQSMDEIATHMNSKLAQKNHVPTDAVLRIQCAQTAWALNYYGKAWLNIPIPSGVEVCPESGASLWGFKQTPISETEKTIVDADCVANKDFY